MDHDQMLLCCMCKNVLQHPMQLGCLHNSCSKCLDDRIGTDGLKSITCPVCMDVTAVEPRNPNTFIVSRLNTSAASLYLSSCWFCAKDGCPDEKADVWCHHCKKSLCADCMPGHSRYNTEHVTTSLQDVQSSNLSVSAPAQQCQLHAKVFDHACLSCAVPQCADCALMCVRANHNVQLLGSPESEAFVRKIKDTISSLQSTLKSMCHTLQKHKNLVGDLKMERDTHIYELEKRKRALSDAIDEAFCDAKAAVRDSFDTLDAKASELASPAEQSDKKLCHALEYSRILTGAGDIIYLLQQQKALLARMETLAQGHDQTKTPLEASKYVIMNNTQLDGSGEVIKAWIGTPVLVTDDLFCSEDQAQSRAVRLRSSAQMTDIQKLRNELEMEVEKRELEEAISGRLAVVEQELQLALQKEQEVHKEDVERLVKDKEQDNSTIKSLEGEVRKSGQLLQESTMAHKKDLANMTAQIQELQHQKQSALSEVASLKAQLKKMEESGVSMRRDLMEFIEHEVPDLGHASATIQTPVFCTDAAVSSDGHHLLLAALQHGLLEYNMNGTQLTGWKPPKKTAQGALNSRNFAGRQQSFSFGGQQRRQEEQEVGGEEQVWAVEALHDGRVAVCLPYSQCLVLLRRVYAERIIPGGSASWLDEDKRIMCGLWIRPWLLSVHADVVVLAEWLLSGSRLSMLSLSRGQELSSQQREYMIGAVAVTAEAVLTSSVWRVKLSDGRERWVVDAYSHDGQRLLWRQEQGDWVTDICAALSGHVLYMAFCGSDTVTAVSAEDGSVIKTVLTSSSHIANRPRRLSVRGRGQGTVLAVLSPVDQSTVTVYRAKRGQ